jgi:hypothetical protein
MMKRGEDWEDGKTRKMRKRGRREKAGGGKVTVDGRREGV